MISITRRIPLAARQLADQLHQHFPDGEVFLVGGSVRDVLLRRPAKDVDLVIRGVAIEPLQQFLSQHGEVNLVGRAFGVLKFTTGEKKPLTIDIALPRTEHSLGHSGAYRDFAVQADHQLPIEDDLSRRDFTINAMAYNLKTKQLVDPFNGQADLTAGRIVAVGHAIERFSEDFSRMLRAIRFSCQLDFVIGPKTWEAITTLAPRINDQHQDEYIVPRETIAKELLKSLRANPLKTIEQYDQTGFLQLLLPELEPMKDCPQPAAFHSEGDVWAHTMLCVAQLDSKAFTKKFGQASMNTVLAALLHDIGKPPTLQQPRGQGDRIRFNGHDILGAKMTADICQRLKLSSYKEADIDVDCDDLVWLVKHHMLTSGNTVKEMKHTTLEKYFFADRPGGDLLALSFADISASIPTSGKPDYTNYTVLEKRLQKLRRTMANKKTLPKPLLNGDEIMAITGMTPGPKLGQLAEKLREVQLSGKVKTKAQAKAFIEKQ